MVSLVCFAVVVGWLILFSVLHRRGGLLLRREKALKSVSRVERIDSLERKLFPELEEWQRWNNIGLDPDSIVVKLKPEKHNWLEIKPGQPLPRYVPNSYNQFQTCSYNDYISVQGWQRAMAGYANDPNPKCALCHGEGHYEGACLYAR